MSIFCTLRDGFDEPELGCVVMTKESKLGLLAAGIVLASASLLTGAVVLAFTSKNAGASTDKERGASSTSYSRPSTPSIRPNKEGQSWAIHDMLEYFEKSELGMAHVEVVKETAPYEFIFYSSHYQGKKYKDAPCQVYVALHKTDEEAKAYAGSQIFPHYFSWGRFAFYGKESVINAIKSILDR